MKKFLLFFSLISIVHLSNAQCGWRGQYQGVVLPGCGSFGYNAPTAASGHREFSQVNGVNYSVQTCGTGWDTQLSGYNASNEAISFYYPAVGYYAYYYNDDSSCGIQSEYTWTAEYSGTIKWQVDYFIMPPGGGGCSPMGSWPSTSAVLQVRQNTTVTNTTSTAPICESQTKNLTYSLGGGGSATPTWSIVAGGGSISGNTYTPANVSSNTTVTVRATLGVCQSDVTFWVNPQPIAVNNTSTATICGGMSKALSGSGGAGTMSIVSGPGSISGFTYIPGAISSNATVTIRYTVVNGICSDFDDVTFNVNAQPTITNTTSNAPICAGTSRSLSASTVGQGVVSYALLSGTGSISGTTYTAGSVASSVPVIIRATITNGLNCTDFADVTFFIDAQPTYTGSTASMCVGETRTLTSNVGGTVFSGPGVSGNTFTAPDPGGVSGNYTITLTKGSCSSVQVLTVYSSPTITSSSADMCVGDTRTLTASLSGGVWSGTGVSGNTFTAPAPSGASQTYTVTYTTLGSPCAPVTQDITVYANPLAANAGEDKPACINYPATLSASNPPIGSGTWTWSPSAPVYAGGTTANDYNAQVTFSAAGSYRGIWTVTSGPCASTSSDTMYVNVSAANNNASLFSSAGAAAESIQAFEVCEEGAWTYYAAPGSPDEYLFAINKHGSSFSAYVDIVDLPGTQTIESLGGSPAIRGTWLIGRYWNVSLLSGSLSTTVDVRFFVDPAEVTQAENEATAFLNNTAAATNMTALTFFKTVSTTFDPATSLVNGEFTFAPAYLPYTTGTLNGVNYYELTGLTSFSGGTGGFSVNDSGSPLPVELLEFNVSTVDNHFIRLDWATASEINNDGFEVLRSTDGVNFERVAWIGGNGNSTEINEYVFNDRGVDKGMTYYYQLKQIDYDGQYEYFDIKSARLDGKTTFTVGALVPNPSKGNSVVAVQVETISGEVLTLDIYDRIGAKVKSMTYVLYAAKNGLDIDISDLEEGTYFLSFESSMGTETRKLVVVK